MDSNFDWEDINSLQMRAITVLEKYKHHQKVIVACNGMLIQSLCNNYHPQNGEIVEFEL